MQQQFSGLEVSPTVTLSLYNKELYLTTVLL